RRDQYPWNGYCGSPQAVERCEKRSGRGMGGRKEARTGTAKGQAKQKMVASMETIALVVLYFIGCLVCQVHVMLMHERIKNWEAWLLALSFLSWLGWALFLVALKVKNGRW